MWNKSQPTIKIQTRCVSFFKLGDIPLIGSAQNTNDSANAKSARLGRNAERGKNPTTESTLCLLKSFFDGKYKHWEEESILKALYFCWNSCISSHKVLKSHQLTIISAERYSLLRERPKPMSRFIIRTVNCDISINRLLFCQFFIESKLL